MRRPFFHERPTTIGFRFLALLPTRAGWQLDKAPRIDPSPIGGLPPHPIRPCRVWLQHVFQVLEETWDRHGRCYWRCIGYAVPADFVRRSPWTSLKRALT